MSMGMPADRSGQRFYLPGVTAALGLTAFFLASHATLSYAQTMALPGSFSVGASGAATYNIPIAVPPGTAGMSPSLTLEYNSQGGNGLLGVGWSLGGLPSVGRCARTLTQDGVVGGVNYDGNDRFCFEGQRLIAISGTYGADGAEYRTEVESFTRVISHGTAGTGPAWFEVHTKSGQVMELGHTADSLVLAQGKPTARTWALNKLSDTKGNYLTATYTNDTTNGQFYPIEIDYTGNAAAVSPANKVQFVYATRPDIVPQYQAGSLMQTTQRLTDVKTFVASAQVADYRLAYQQSGSSNRSRVTSIQVCGGSGNCLPATTMNWNDGGGGITQANNAAGIPNSSGWNGAYSFYPGDYNGDGITDVFLVGSAGSFFCAGPGITSINDCVPIPNSSGWNGAYSFYPGDYNGDGITDVFLVGSAGSFFCAGPGITSINDCVPVAGAGGWKAAYSFYPGDYNGDGITDVFLVGSAGSFFCAGPGITSINDCVPVANASGWKDAYSFYPGDYNGDGITDVFLVGSAGSFFCAGPGITSINDCVPIPNSSGWNGAYSFYPGDYNGDGITDVFLVGSAGSFFCAGPGITSINDCVPVANASGWKAAYSFYPGDYNGDGITDVFLVGSAGSFFCAGPGITSINDCVPVANASGWKDAYSFYPGDYNGDGTVDLFIVGSASSYFAAGGYGQPDHLTQIATGLGATTMLTYQPLTKSSVYSKDKTAVYPLQDLQSPLYVVSRVDTSNGVGGTYSSSYSYAGAKADLSGRGFLGFRQVAATDLQTNIVQTTMYRQDFPYIGLAASTTKSLNTLTLNRTATSYQFSNASGTSSVGAPSGAGAPYKVSVAQSVAQSSDLDGTALPSVTTTYQYDGFGNPTQVVASTPDGFSKTTTNTYTNDATHWLLGRLTRASVSSVAP